MLHAKLHHLFLGLTWASHYAFIMLLIGTPVLGLWQHLRGREEGAAWRMLRSYYPVIISLTITTGVAPLLFNQTFSHRYFYRTFINLYPLPLIGLLLLIGFFYLSYAVVRLRRWHTAMVAMQILCLVAFALFFGALYNGIIHPEQHRAWFWLNRWPGFLWHSTGAHFLIALTGSSLYYALAGKPWWLRVLPLAVIAAAVSTVREIIRTKALGEHYPAPIIEGIDISIVVFLFFLVVMIVVIYRCVRIAFAPSLAEGEPGQKA